MSAEKGDHYYREGWPCAENGGHVKAYYDRLDTPTAPFFN